MRASLVTQLVKNPPAMWETWVQSGLGRSPGERKGYPCQYSGLENSMDCILLQRLGYNWATFKKKNSSHHISVCNCFLIFSLFGLVYFCLVSSEDVFGFFYFNGSFYNQLKIMNDHRISIFSTFLYFLLVHHLILADYICFSIYLSTLNTAT